MVIQHLAVEAYAVSRREGVYLAADGVHLTGKVAGAAGGGAFEDHVLYIVRVSVL